MINLKNILILPIFIVCVFLVPQNTTGAELGNKILFTLNPVSPGAYEDTKVTIRSFAADLSKSLIIWSLDGVEYARGYNLNSIDFLTEGLGKTTVIKVKIQNPNQAPLIESIVVTPVEINMFWQSNSYTPAFYRSQPPAGAGADITVTADVVLKESGGSTVDPRNLIYEWSRNHQQVSSQSGIGRMTFSFQKGPGNDIVGVIIKKRDNSIVGQSQLNLPLYTPLLRTYRIQPIIGIDWTRSLKEGDTLGGEEITIKAETYALSKINQNHNLLFNWTINNTPTSGREDNSSLLTFLTTPESASRDLFLGLTVYNPNPPITQSVLKIPLTINPFSLNF